MESHFARKIEALDEVFDFIEEFFAANNLDAATRYAIGMAVEEVFTNMVKYNPDGTGDLAVRIDRDGDRAVIDLVDSDSERFDPTAEEEVDVTRPLDERTPGGLGIHLVRKLMDKFDYSYDDGKSTITLVKTLNQPC